MTIEPIHLVPEVKFYSYIIMYSKFSTVNYSIAGKKRPLACFQRYLYLPTLPYLIKLQYLLVISTSK